MGINKPFTVTDDDDSLDGSNRQLTTGSGGRSSSPREGSATGRSSGTRMVYLVLAVAAAGFAITTYIVLIRSAENEFKSEFASYAREVAELTESQAENTFGQLRSLATAITSMALENDDNPNGQKDFPYLSIPHFDLRSKEISELTGAEMFLFLPFVEQDKQGDFEAFLRDRQGWLADDYESRGLNASHLKPIPESIYETPAEYINEQDTRRGFVDADGFMEDILENLGHVRDGFSVPIAQYGPGTTNSSLTLMDLFTHQIFKKEFVSSLEYDVPVISESLDLQFLLNHVQVSGNTTANDGRLRSFTLHEVKEDFHPKARTVGFVMAVVPWDTFVDNHLPDKVQGIVVKVTSDCGSIMTFVLYGNGNITQQNGDWHDSKYDDMAIQTRFFWKDHPVGASRHCHFDLIIYPSDEFHQAYKSKDALLYAGVVAAVFLFMMAVFFFHDLYLLRGQRKLATQAAKAQAVVRSLFPRDVGQQLMEEVDNHSTGARSVATSKARLQNFVTKNTAEPETRSKPIADLFPETTVLFADIVGFTAWSSTREPTQVFTLLETIYRAFDKIAKRRGVFKVETVGDCYVAGTSYFTKDVHGGVCTT
eukprot:scaffold10917_cov155-Amphora_coffeaeformis.AAC.6